LLGDEFQRILDGARQGARPALGAIYRDLYPGVLAYLRSKVPGEAEDLAADVFVDVARNISGFTGDERALRAWVFTIARRRAIDAGRRTARRATDAVPVETLHRIAAVDDPAAEAIEGLDVAAALVLVDRLPSRHAEVVRLRVIAGLNVAETAAALGKREGTVRVLQHRALRRLAQLLHEDQTRGGVT
jgi:RNA polymerase sigma-70 factor, ECF subfamily